MRFTRFVKGTYVYTFPNTQINGSDNFADLVTQTVRMPGADGGFDGLGDGRGLNEIGTVRAEFWLHHAYGAATTEVDAFRRMADVGVGRLYMQPTSANQSERWCWARVNSINHADAARDVPDRRMRMRVVWQASDPFWYGSGNSVVWGGGAKWGGATWGGGAAVIASGLSTTTTITNNGNAYTYLQAAVRPGVGLTANDVIIRRVRDGVIEDEVRWAGTLAAGDVLAVEARGRTVRVNGTGAYDARFSARGAEWLRLLPGANTIEIKFANSTDAADVQLRYLERWV
jgi:hypothetical protein